MTASLHVLPSAQLQDIPAMLRRLADDIEAGEYGEARECAVVLNAQQLEVFGFGAADGTVAHYLLCCGADRLRRPLVDR